MGILKLLPTTRLGYAGQRPPLRDETSASTLHFTSSLNGIPAIKRQPSQLDLDGKTPPKYLDNLPG